MVSFAVEANSSPIRGEMYVRYFYLREIEVYPSNYDIDSSLYFVFMISGVNGRCLSGNKESFIIILNIKILPAYIVFMTPH